MNFLALAITRSPSDRAELPRLKPGQKEKSPAPIPNLREPNAGLVSLTMACLSYLVLWYSRKSPRRL